MDRAKDNITPKKALSAGELNESACPIGACPIGSTFFDEFCLIMNSYIVLRIAYRGED